MKTALLVLAISSMSVFAADECPVVFNGPDFLQNVLALTKKASSCDEASKLVEACALGSGLDSATVSGAIARCEGLNKKMTNKQNKKTYAYLNSLCDVKFAKSEGSMAISGRSFCYLSVTTLLNNLLSADVQEVF